MIVPVPSGVRRRSLLSGVILAALMHGLVYVFLAPPWQHYDEPNHFEYAWLIAHRGSLPKPGDHDLQMRRDVAASMIAAGFFEDMDFLPDLGAADPPPWIGSYSQLGDPPLYYLLAALPLWAFSGLDVTAQLYAARLLSLCLYLLTMVAAWGLVGELVRPNSPLRWLLPLTMALVPSFADLMTAVNSDVGAVACFSFFLWGSVRLVQRGFAWMRLMAVLLAAGLCLGTKPNVFVAAPLLLPVLLFTLLRGRWRWLAWAALAGMVLLGGWAVFTGGEAAFWYRQAKQATPLRQKSDQAVLGQHVFALETSLAGTPATQAARFWQMIPPGVLRPLEGQVVTLGAWAWASRPVVVQSPALHAWGSNRDFSQSWSLDVLPTFYAFTLTVPSGAKHGWVSLLPLADQAGVRVYFDGLVFAAGEHPAWPPPSFDGADGQTGRWGQVSFVNLLRGASAEASWPGVRTWADELSEHLLPDRGRLSFVLYTLLDWPGTGWHYRSVMANLLRTFWAVFGWGNVWLWSHPWLVFGRPYLFLAGATVLGLLGALLPLFQQRKSLPWAVLLCLGLSLILVWGFTYVRGSIYLVYQQHFIPGARYAYPAMIPTVMVLAAGWLAWGRGLRRFLRIPRKWLVAAYVVFFVALDGLAIVSIARFYS